MNDEILPLFGSFIEAVAEKEDEQDKILVELIEDTGDLLHEETANQIIDALEKGARLCEIVEGLELEDDLLAKKLQKAREEYEMAAVIASQLVEQLTIFDDEDDEGEDEKDADDSDRDGRDGDGDDGDAPTVAEEEDSEEASKEV